MSRCDACGYDTDDLQHQWPCLITEFSDDEFDRMWFDWAKENQPAEEFAEHVYSVAEAMQQWYTQAAHEWFWNDGETKQDVFRAMMNSDYRLWRVHHGFH